MPIIKSAVKRMRQTLKRRARNITTKRTMRNALKAFGADKTSENLSQAHAKIDTAVKKKVLNKNTAARKKAQLARQAKETVKPAKKTKPASTKTKTTTKKPAAKKAPAKAPKK